MDKVNGRFDFTYERGSVTGTKDNGAWFVQVRSPHGTVVSAFAIANASTVDGAIRETRNRLGCV